MTATDLLRRREKSAPLGSPLTVLNWRGDCEGVLEAITGERCGEISSRDYWLSSQSDSRSSACSGQSIGSIKLVLPKVFGFFGLEGHQPPLAGVFVTLGLILLGGALARSFLGRGFIRIWERLIDRVPVARSIYSVLKQFMEAIFGMRSRDGLQSGRSHRVPAQGDLVLRIYDGRYRRRNSGPASGADQALHPEHTQPHHRLLPDGANRGSGRYGLSASKRHSS